MVTPDIDVLVVGAGLVGLSAAAALAEQGAKVMVLERHAGPGRETSSRNSEVLHSGVYYPTGSLKARLCVEGNRRLRSFCDAFGVQRHRPGKLIVATAAEEVPELERLAALGSANGVPDLRMLDAGEVRELEPHVQAVAALHSPSTGIVDSHGLLKVLEARTRAAGGHIAYQSRLTALDPGVGGFRLRVDTPAGSEVLGSRLVVNCAGLEADKVAAMAHTALDLPQHWCKGQYFTLGGPWRRRIKRLIYPAPHPDLTGLGIHLTINLAGQMRLGPDTEYLTRGEADLDVDPSRAMAFLRAVRRYLPGVQGDELMPDTAGIRPKLQGPDDPWRDFVVREESAAGLPGLVNLLGIESPGLTCCLPLADLVVDTLRHAL